MKRLLTLLVAVVSATGLRAEGYQVNNLSTRQTGMGHVGTAMKLNSESIFFNPAATAFQDSKFDLSVGAAGILSYCTYTPSPTMENGFYSGNRPEWESDNKMSTPIYAYFNYKPSDRCRLGFLHAQRLVDELGRRLARRESGAGDQSGGLYRAADRVVQALRPSVDRCGSDDHVG